jgi:hypothetical protein
MGNISKVVKSCRSRQWWQGATPTRFVSACGGDSQLEAAFTTVAARARKLHSVKLRRHHDSRVI